MRRISLQPGCPGFGVGQFLQQGCGGANPNGRWSGVLELSRRGDDLVGRFSIGKTISAQMIGEASDYDPRSGSVATVSRPRDPNVEGPGGFFFADAQAPGLLTFIAPANGTYRFSFSPCAMWGAEGAVRICAR
jgi:hypothetical protein